MVEEQRQQEIWHEETFGPGKYRRRHVECVAKGTVIYLIVHWPNKFTFHVPIIKP